MIILLWQILTYNDDPIILLPDCFIINHTGLFHSFPTFLNLDNSIKTFLCNWEFDLCGFLVIRIAHNNEHCKSFHHCLFITTKNHSDTLIKRNSFQEKFYLFLQTYLTLFAPLFLKEKAFIKRSSKKAYFLQVKPVSLCQIRKFNVNMINCNLDVNKIDCNLDVSLNERGS